MTCTVRREQIMLRDYQCLVLSSFSIVMGQDAQLTFLENSFDLDLNNFMHLYAITWLYSTSPLLSYVPQFFHIPHLFLFLLLPHPLFSLLSPNSAVSMSLGNLLAALALKKNNWTFSSSNQLTMTLQLVRGTHEHLFNLHWNLGWLDLVQALCR